MPLLIASWRLGLCPMGGYWMLPVAVGWANRTRTGLGSESVRVSVLTPWLLSWLFVTCTGMVCVVVSGVNVSVPDIAV